MRAKEWGTCTQVDRMLKRLDPKRHRRQWVLFNCACCRRVWEKVPAGACRAYVEAAERYALGTGLKKDLAPLRGRVHEAFDNALRSPGTGRTDAALAAMAVTNTTRFCAWNAASAAGEKGRVAHRRERHAQADLLREVMGNLYRPVAVEPAWLTWNGGAVPKMAQAVLADGRFSDLPILADALEEAGCADAELLGHLRGPGPHVKGCWAIDLLLGKS
jgi:hypothetical protein